MKGPIIAAGWGRRGTRLLHGLLGTHPGISMIRRSNMFRWCHGRLGDPGKPESLQRCLQAMLPCQCLAPLATERPGKGLGVPAARLIQGSVT